MPETDQSRFSNESDSASDDSLSVASDTYDYQELLWVDAGSESLDILLMSTSFHVFFAGLPSTSGVEEWLTPRHAEVFREWVQCRQPEHFKTTWKSPHRNIFWDVECSFADAAPNCLIQPGADPVCIRVLTCSCRTKRKRQRSTMSRLA